MAKFISVPLANVVDSGTTTSASSGKLVQTGQNFTTTVKVGDVVRNTTDSTWTTVTAVDSATTLSLADDIMDNAEAFTIYSGTLTTNQNISAENVVLCQQATTATVTVAYGTGSTSTDVVTITHKAIASTSAAVRQAVEAALELASSNKSLPDSAVTLTLPSGVVAVSIAVA